jgi:hypothetical protein
MSRWYYAKGDRQSGPVSDEELKLLAETGLLLPTDSVWKEGESKRRPAGTLKNLFPDGPGMHTLPGPSQATPPRPGPRPAASAATPPPPVEQTSEPPRTGPTLASVIGFLVAMLSIFLGGGASYLYWTNTHRPLVLPTALLGLLLSNLVLLADWFSDRARFSLSVLGVTLSTGSLLTVFVDDGGLLKTRNEVRQVLARFKGSERPAPPSATNGESRDAPRNEPKASGEIQVAKGETGSSRSSAARSEAMTRKDLIAKIEALGVPCSRSELFAAVGKPQEERTQEGQLAGLLWTWHCNDGKVEVILLNPEFGSGEHTDKSLAYVSKITEK